jgi:hypothetical protein
MSRSKLNKAFSESAFINQFEATEAITGYQLPLLVSAGQTIQSLQVQLIQSGSEYYSPLWETIPAAQLPANGNSYNGFCLKRSSPQPNMSSFTNASKLTTTVYSSWTLYNVWSSDIGAPPTARQILFTPQAIQGVSGQDYGTPLLPQVTVFQYLGNWYIPTGWIGNNSMMYFPANSWVTGSYIVILDGSGKVIFDGPLPVVDFMVGTVSV